VQANLQIKNLKLIANDSAGLLFAIRTAALEGLPPMFGCCHDCGARINKYPAKFPY